jgi:hypothetical protein
MFAKRLIMAFFALFIGVNLVQDPVITQAAQVTPVTQQAELTLSKSSKKVKKPKKARKPSTLFHPKRLKEIGKTVAITAGFALAGALGGFLLGGPALSALGVVKGIGIGLAKATGKSLFSSIFREKRVIEPIAADLHDACIVAHEPTFEEQIKQVIITNQVPLAC